MSAFQQLPAPSGSPEKLRGPRGAGVRVRLGPVQRSSVGRTHGYMPGQHVQPHPASSPVPAADHSLCPPAPRLPHGNGIILTDIRQSRGVQCAALVAHQHLRVCAVYCSSSVFSPVFMNMCLTRGVPMCPGMGGVVQYAAGSRGRGVSCDEPAVAKDVWSERV